MIGFSIAAMAAVIVLPGFVVVLRRRWLRRRWLRARLEQIVAPYRQRG